MGWRYGLGLIEKLRSSFMDFDINISVSRNGNIMIKQTLWIAGNSDRLKTKTISSEDRKVTFNDYLEREYNQVIGSGGHPIWMKI